MAEKYLTKIGLEQGEGVFHKLSGTFYLSEHHTTVSNHVMDKNLNSLLTMNPQWLFHFCDCGSE